MSSYEVDRTLPPPSALHQYEALTAFDKTLYGLSLPGMKVGSRIRRQFAKCFEKLVRVVVHRFSLSRRCNMGRVIPKIRKVPLCIADATNINGGWWRVYGLIKTT